MTRAALLVILLAASVANANVWDEALAHGKDRAQDTYDTELRNGDEHALLADNKGISPREVRLQVQLAATAYRAAAAAKPDEGEPYYRLGMLILSFYGECEKDPRFQPFKNPPLCTPNIDRKRAEEVIDAWNQFEARAPLDPRLSIDPDGESQVLFTRALLHTKLATKPHLEAAALDYEKILARNDRARNPSEQILGNLAETYMMLGRMDDALDLYREALRSAAHPSTWYGYAIALDRDEHTQQAIEVIKSVGSDGRKRFRDDVTRGLTFFVPEGEKYYYLALSDEAFGLDELAITSWRLFLASGAHPEFQPRARAHLDGLLAKKRRKALPIDPPWQEIFPR